MQSEKRDASFTAVGQCSVFTEIRQTEALTQIELKQLNVFNSLFGGVHKINPILPFSKSRPQWKFLYLKGNDKKNAKDVSISAHLK